MESRCVMGKSTKTVGGDDAVTGGGGDRTPHAPLEISAKGLQGQVENMARVLEKGRDLAARFPRQGICWRQRLHPGFEEHQFCDHIIFYAHPHGAKGRSLDGIELHTPHGAGLIGDWSHECLHFTEQWASLEPGFATQLRDFAADSLEWRLRDDILQARRSHHPQIGKAQCPVIRSKALTAILLPKEPGQTRTGRFELPIFEIW